MEKRGMFSDARRNIGALLMPGVGACAAEKMRL